MSPVDADTMRREPVTLEIGGKSALIDAEVAETPAEKALGLMFRTSLGDDQGMLFVYPEDQEIHMWMHNTYLPLDMVFIRADGRVHRVVPDTEPLSDAVIDSKGSVRAVLELKAGTAARLGLKAGDRVAAKSLGILAAGP